MENPFPPSLLLSLKKEESLFDEQSFLEEHQSGKQITSIRLNPFKPVHIFDGEESVPWLDYGKYLKERPAFIEDPLFHAGCYYVQEASSMFLGRVMQSSIDLDQALRVLDLCAAPGGKSTLIASLINGESLLVANEIIKSRVNILADNLTKWGNQNCVVTNNDPRDFGRTAGYFDVMVADAPCSGSGMFRKDRAAIDEWSENNVQLCSQRQQRILADAYAALRQYGILIYSTCSYSSEENEQIADWLCDTFQLESVKIPVESSWGITETVSPKHHCFGYRFYPHKVKGEGFYIACFRKLDGTERAEVPKIKPLKADQKHLSIIRSWVKPENLSLLPVADGYSLIPAPFEAEVRYLQSKLYIKKAGVYAGKIIGKDLIPDQELAQSLLLNDEVSKVNLSKEQALRYLRKDTLQIDSIRTGWTLMCYDGYGLGWAKVLPNRINNYYPKELRIIKEIW